MTACVPDERLRLPVAPSPTAVAQMVSHWVLRTPSDADTTGDSEGFPCAVHRWMNANQCTGTPMEFLMERIYEALKRTIEVVGGPRFTHTHTEMLRGLVEKHRPGRLSVYAFGMLLRTGDWPSAMRATDHWLGDKHTIGCGAVCRSTYRAIEVDALLAIHRSGLLQEFVTNTRARCVHGGLTNLAMRRLLAGLYITADGDDGKWMCSSGGHPLAESKLHIKPTASHH